MIAKNSLDVCNTAERDHDVPPCLWRPRLRRNRLVLCQRLHEHSVRLLVCAILDEQITEVDQRPRMLNAAVRIGRQQPAKRLEQNTPCGSVIGPSKMGQKIGNAT